MPKKGGETTLKSNVFGAGCFLSHILSNWCFPLNKFVETIPNQIHFGFQSEKGEEKNIQILWPPIYDYQPSFFKLICKFFQIAASNYRPELHNITSRPKVAPSENSRTTQLSRYTTFPTTTTLFTISSLMPLKHVVSIKGEPVVECVSLELMNSRN